MRKFLLILLGLVFSGFVEAQTEITDDMVISDSKKYSDITIGVGGSITITGTGVLTVTGTLINTDETKLVVEEGGQLITSSLEVKATLQKKIKKFKDGIGWHSICSPMSDMAISGSDFMSTGSSDGNTSLFWFNEKETSEEWRNYWAEDNGHFENFDRGYLYASKNMSGDQKIMSFKGTINVSSVTVTDVYYTKKKQELMGFNLLGNPFMENILLSNITGSKANGYYIADGNNGTWVVCDASTPIPPGMGVLVKYTAKPVYDSQDYQAGITKPDHSIKNDRFDVSDNRLCLNLHGINEFDRAYVYFDEGFGLNKVEPLSETASSLSVRYEDTLYAIAHVGEFCDMVDVVFDNTQAGWYTLSVDNECAKLNYLHLIDNVTGEEVDMLKENSYRFYTFGNESENRFKLVMNSGAGVSEEQTFAYISNGNIIITGLDGTATLQVFDVMGRLICADVIKKTDGVASGVTKPSSVGVYVLRLITDKGVKTQKIVIE